MASKQPVKKLAKKRRSPKKLLVVDAVRRDLARLAKLDPSLANNTLAATALALARDLDDPGNSATSHSMCAKALAETMGSLYALAPEGPKGDRLDELSSRRAARLAGGAGA